MSKIARSLTGKKADGEDMDENDVFLARANGNDDSWGLVIAVRKIHERTTTIVYTKGSTCNGSTVAETPATKALGNIIHHGGVFLGTDRLYAWMNSSSSVGFAEGVARLSTRPVAAQRLHKVGLVVVLSSMDRYPTFTAVAHVYMVELT